MTRKERAKTIVDDDYVGRFRTESVYIKEYDGTFDIDKAWSLLQPETCEKEMRVKSQIESVKYALSFARKGNNEAKNFIITIINNPELSDDKIVVKKAQDAFYLFITAYVRSQLQEYYKMRHIVFDSEEKRIEALEEASQESWIEIMRQLPKYDPSKGAITTFIKMAIFEGFNQYESKRNEKPSKQKMSNDVKIAQAIQALRSKGIPVNPRTVEIEVEQMYPGLVRKIKIPQVLESIARTEAQMTSFSMDESEDYDDRTNIKNKMKQRLFMLPEEAVERAEQTEKLLNAIEQLDHTEQQIFMESLGYETDSSQICMTERKSDEQLAREYDMTASDIFRIKTRARIAIRKELNPEKDALILKGRDLKFMDEMKEDTFIDSIIAITEEDFVE